MPDDFKYLRVVKMVVDFAVWEETSAALCLLRSCPNLKKLEIKGKDYERRYDFRLSEEFWRHEYRLKLRKLLVLKLTAFTCSDAGLDFMKFLLPRAVRLAKLVIDPNEHGRIDDLEFANGPRTFTKAEVKCRGIKIGSDHSDHDTSTMSENMESDTDEDTDDSTSEDTDDPYEDTDDDTDEDIGNKDFATFYSLDWYHI